MAETFNAVEYEDEPTILESEVRWALGQLANGKAPGVDNIPIELLKAAGEEDNQVLTGICQRIWATKTWPNEWKRSVYVTIPRKGDSRECANNRTIALIPHASKVLLKIIPKRLEPFLERELPEEQAGFRHGRGCRDQIANMRWLMEKTIERQQDLYICFIDYKKAFDNVDHNILWKELRHLGVPEHLIILMERLYEGQQATVRTDFGETEPFLIGKGVRQGCILSPYLYNLYSEIIMRNAGLDKMEIGLRIGGRLVNNDRFADDITLISTAKSGLIQLLRSVKQESEKYGLYLNLGKTKVMTTGNMDEFIINCEKIEQAENVIFLGSNVNEVETAVKKSNGD